MPFGESQSRIYVSIVEGMLAVRSSESDAKAVKRELKTGHTIYENRYKFLSGKLKEIGFKTNDFNGKKWEDLYLLIFDGQDHFQLSMPFPGKYSISVLRVIKNVDLNSTITFTPWTKTINDKVKAALFFNMQGTKESVPWYYTKDDPKGLPELVPYSVPGSTEQKWSDVERNKFFKQMIENDIVPELRKLWQSAPAAEALKPNTDMHSDIDAPDAVDDLPF